MTAKNFHFEFEFTGVDDEEEVELIAEINQHAGDLIAEIVDWAVTRGINVSTSYNVVGIFGENLPTVRVSNP